MSQTIKKGQKDAVAKSQDETLMAIKSVVTHNRKQMERDSRQD